MEQEIDQALYRMKNNLEDRGLDGAGADAAIKQTHVHLYGNFSGWLHLATAGQLRPRFLGAPIVLLHR